MLTTDKNGNLMQHSTKNFVIIYKDIHGLEKKYHTIGLFSDAVLERFKQEMSGKYKEIIKVEDYGFLIF